MELLGNVITDKKFQGSYFEPFFDLESKAHLAQEKVDQICSRWRVPKEVGQDLVKLSLFDIILFIGKAPSDLFTWNTDSL